MADISQPHPENPVYVIGGGPGGLSAAAALRAQGVRAVVLERSDSIGASWRQHYDRLRLHTTRRLSSLPGLTMPRSFGRWVARDNVIRYLERYADFHDLEIVTGVEISRIDRAPAGDGWLLHGSGGRELTGSAVVIATGYNHTPHLPDWPGLDTFPGKFLHAADYRNAAPYAGQDVLVVGVGNTGAEIAVDLVEGGAARVRLAVRTAPCILRRTTLGWSAQRSGVLFRRLPASLVDRLSRPLAKLATPDLSAQGMPRPSTGPRVRAKEGTLPVLDMGLVNAVRHGHVEPVAAVASFERGENSGSGDVVLADGSRLSPQTVIAATGYRTALEPLVGHLGVLNARGLPVSHGRRTPTATPGLYFTGYTTPVSGALRELALNAKKIAKAIVRERARAKSSATKTPADASTNDRAKAAAAQ
ncbi:flavin-containing monooxygenase [Streptomyces apocyni]|uniref:flavin-containing monooxygenase n=1 Tax=Streptomyces apocyni TaxID=2654677 RepID=UPI0012EAEDB7|nr:NAD(P)/FAD-dependent oxidoreductase [Streptomyces apocyni]